MLRFGVQLSKRGEYALRVLLDLTIARSQGIAVVPVTALASAQNIPTAFLEQILVALVQTHGWEQLGRQIDIRCFTSDPSIKSSLTFLRKTPWARKKVENLYVWSCTKKD